MRLTKSIKVQLFSVNLINMENNSLVWQKMFQMIYHPRSNSLRTILFNAMCIVDLQRRLKILRETYVHEKELPH